MSSYMATKCGTANGAGRGHPLPKGWRVGPGLGQPGSRMLSRHTGAARSAPRAAQRERLPGGFVPSVG